jgi:hypothetical protein
MEVKLEVWDSPNSAGVVIDAVRCAKLAMDRGVGGALIGPSCYFMKSPPRAVHRRGGARAPWLHRRPRVLTAVTPTVSRPPVPHEFQGGQWAGWRP